MAPHPPNDHPTVAFASREAWEAWLETEHDRSKGVWLQIAKKGAGVDSVSYAEALEAALCHGWIDGQKRSLDDSHWLQRFTPRTARSKWSRINRDKAQALIDAGRMKPAGLREVERAKAAGTPPTRARGPPPSPTTSSGRSTPIRRRGRSSRRSTAPTATRSSTASRTPSGLKPARGASRSTSRC